MSTTDNKAKRKTVTKKKTATSKKTASKKKATTKKKVTAQKKTATAKSKTVKAPDVKGLHPVLPYAIAATFIFLTAGLTMLMTSLLSETSDAVRSLEEATEGVQRSPSLLAEARESFTTPTAALPASKPDLNTLPVVTTPVPAQPAPTTQMTVARAADDTSKYLVSTDKPKTVANIQVPVAPVEKSRIMKAREQANLVFLNHQQRVAQIRKRIQENADKHEQQIEAYITGQMKAMNDEIERIESMLMPVAPPRAVETYQKIIERRRESFNRMMEQRKKLLQDIRQRRTELRQRYTQLLSEVYQAVS